MRVYAFRSGGPDTRQAWKLDVSLAWVRRNDNGCLISIGISVPDELSERALKRLGARAVPVSWDDYAHSGCQSGGGRRGNAACRW